MFLAQKEAIIIIATYLSNKEKYSGFIQLWLGLGQGQGWQKGIAVVAGPSHSSRTDSNYLAVPGLVLELTQNICQFRVRF